MNRKLFNLAKSSALVFALGFLPVPFLIHVGYAPLLVCSFSMALMLLWSDGLLTLFSIRKGATEINPIINFLNNIAGEKRGVLLSRVVGSIFPLVGLLERNLYFTLAISWVFAAVIFLNSATLLSVLAENIDAKQTYHANE
ncbi:MAG: hypothetical protein ABSG57_01120 [Candidatus Bathyarchaeia archaeon]